MFSRRISATDAAPTPISAVDARNARNAASRCSAVSFFESSSMAASSDGMSAPQDDRGRDHRAGQWTSSGLIHAGDASSGGQFHVQTGHRRSVAGRAELRKLMLRIGRAAGMTRAYESPSLR